MNKSIFASAVFTLAALFSLPAAGGVIECTASFDTVTLTGNVVVPKGATCNLHEVTITGNLTVRGALNADTVTVGGNVQANHADWVIFDDPTIAGNFIATHTQSGPNCLGGGSVGGNVIIQNSAAGAFWSVGIGGPCDEGDSETQTVGKNLHFQNNRGGGEIGGNTVDGNLDCHNNDPAPTVGTNTVGGKTKAQCL